MELFPLNYSSDILYIKNKTIREYDMQSGGYSIAISENLINDDEELLVRLKNADKKEKQILLGNYSKVDKEFTNKLHQNFREYVSGFITLNEIDRSKILRIAKDSVLFYGTNEIKRTQLRKVHFTKRGEWTSYLKINNIIFLYDGKNDSWDIRGVGKIENFENSLLEFVINLLKINENNPKIIPSLLRDFREDYVNRNLFYEFYRQMNNNSLFQWKTKVNGKDAYTNILDDSLVSMIDINYNYINVIIPLCQIFL